MILPTELDFLKEHMEEAAIFYQRADWLLSPFSRNIWKYDFGFKKGYKCLNWNVKLSDGSQLTDPKNSDLLHGLKYWLIASTTPSVGGMATSIKVQYAAFNRTLHLIDFLLINENFYKLSTYGMAGISADDLKEILRRLATSSLISESLFDWPNEVITFLRDLRKNTNTLSIASSIETVPGLGIINISDDEEAQKFGIEPQELLELRATLHINKLTAHNRRLGYTPNSAKLSKAIYGNTLKLGTTNKPAISMLSYSHSKGAYDREFPSVNVTTGTGESLSPVAFIEYVKSIYSLGILHEVNIPAPPINDIIEIRGFTPALKEMGRYRTLPSQLVFDAVKDGIEFHLNHGRDVLDGFLRIALAAKKSECDTCDLDPATFEASIGPRLKAFGVKDLGMLRSDRSMSSYIGDLNSCKEAYFSSFRANQSLIPLVYVYFGAVQVVVGALTARRIGELNDLEVGISLDKSGNWIVFLNRKSTRGLRGHRSREARPIEPIAAEMLQELNRFHAILNRIGFGEKVNFVFSSPSLHDNTYRTSASTFSYNKHLDFFCDYFQTARDQNGCRYYIRQHQLRRFFALLFFYSNSFGSLETLQWMLGHNDLRHAWHYITESMSGEVLRGAKSQFIAESLHHSNGQSFKDLAQLIEKRYQTSDFSLLDTDELEDYLSDLLDEGEIEIEPEFFTDPDGEKFKVIVKIHDKIQER